MSDLSQPTGQGPDYQPDGPTASPRIGLLRYTAIVGTGIVLVWRVTSLFGMRPRQEWGILVVAAAAIAVGLVCRLLMPAATARLGRHMDLLLPLGFYIPTETMLGLLAKAPITSALLSPSWSFRVLSISFTLSLAFLLEIVLAVVYAGWTTTLILQAVGRDRVEPLPALAAMRRWFWPVLGVETLGWFVMFAALALGIAVGAAVLPLALIGIGVFALIWNLATAALLPVVVGRRRPFGEAVREGIRLSWRGKGRWWKPVVAQMILLGWIVFFVVSYTDDTAGSYHMYEKTQFSVKAFWTGGYEDECHWYTELMKTVETEPLPLATSLLGILFAVLAIVVKLEITAGLFSPAAVPEEAPSPQYYGADFTTGP
ncbi:MAG: hypothetical protein ACLQLG_17935 [Thermoguttaceae bacterium]